MKTKAVFTSLLGLTLATSILAGSTAEAQMRTSLAPKKATAKSTLKAKVAVAPAKEEPKSRFSLSINETYYGKLDNNKNYVESYFIGGFDVVENLSLGIETGLESYIEDQKSNNAMDIEGTLTVSGIEIAKDFTLATGLMAIFPSSRASRDKNMSGAYGVKANFGLKLGNVSIGLENNFYQIGYKTAPTATPDETMLDESDKRFYSNDISRATSVLSAAIPIGPVKFKNDLRVRQATPYTGEEKRPMRFRSRLAYGITDGLTVQGGVYWQKDMIDPKAPSYFNQKHRTFVLQLSLDV